MSLFSVFFTLIAFFMECALANVMILFWKERFYGGICAALALMIFFVFFTLAINYPEMLA